MNDLKHPYKCLNVLGNELRIDIIELLKEKPRTVSEIIKITGKEQSKISHSLQQLRKCKFIDFRQNGKVREYYLKSKIFEKKDKTLFELVEEHVRENCYEK
jgi:DNA-binding transcriptional ArsR family regulator